MIKQLELVSGVTKVTSQRFGRRSKASGRAINPNTQVGLGAEATQRSPRDLEQLACALEGLPHYWKLDWGFIDKIIFPCGHEVITRTEWLEDPAHEIGECPYIDMGMCNE